MAAARNSSSRSSALLRLGVATVACAGLASLSAPATPFVGGSAGALRGGRVVMLAEAGAPAPAPSSSTALVTVSEENVVTSASVLGGVAGLLVGGIWLGAGLFAATSYLVRRDDDVSAALKGSSEKVLEALNFTASMNEKYEVTGKVGGALTNAVDSAKSGSESTKQSLDQVGGLVDQAKGAIESVDKDVGIKDTVGSLLISASDLASQAIEKAIDLNGQYKITDQLSEKVQEATKQASAPASK